MDIPFKPLVLTIALDDENMRRLEEWQSDAVEVYTTLREWRKEDADLIANMAYEIVDLRRELAEAKKGSERLDWLERMICQACYGEIDGEYVDFDSLTRAAIDKVKEE